MTAVLDPRLTGTAGQARNLPLIPGTDEWLMTITPSKVAAILGVSRWESAYRLWHRMKGLTAQEPAQEIFDIGHDFEPAAAAIWKRRNPGWLLSPDEVQIRRGAEEFGYPCAATLDRRARRGSHRRVVEFKTARKLEEWGDEFTDEAPADYTAQILYQMAVTGYTKHPGHLLVLGPWFDNHLYEIPYDAALIETIHDKCFTFYESLSQTTPPDLDDSVATYECVREQHPDIEAGKVATLEDSELASAALWYAKETKAAEKTFRGLKSRVLDAMKQAQYLEWQGIRIASRSPHGSGSVSLTLQVKNLEQVLEKQSTTTDEEF